MSEVEKMNAEIDRISDDLDELELAGKAGDRAYGRGLAELDRLDEARNVLVRLSRGRG